MYSCYTSFKTFSPSTNSSSSLSDSRNSSSPVSILTRKARTPRKRPNQTYNEAAAILSTAYPKIFPLKKPQKFTNNRSPPFPCYPDEHHVFLLRDPPAIVKKTNSKGGFEKACQSQSEVESRVSDYAQEEELSAESLLDEEIGEGIDSIMGYELMKDAAAAAISSCNSTSSVEMMSTCCNGYPVGLGFEGGVRRELRAMRHVDEGDWWRFPCVDVAQITQHEKKKKKENAAAAAAAAGLGLKLDYDDVLKAWSDKGSPFSRDAQSTGNDVQVRLGQTDTFPEKLYKEKRCTRLFSKKPRYQITKVNAADQRPRLKGRFVKSGDPIDND